MKVGNRFQIVYWAILATGLTYFFVLHVYSDLVSGSATTVHIILFLIWLAILVVPLFQEVDIFGIRLKSEIESMRNDFKEQILNLRTEIQNTQNVQTFVSPQFYFEKPPPDSELPRIKRRFQNLLGQTAGSKQSSREPKEEMIEIPPDDQFLMAVRYQIEKQLRDIWEMHHGTERRTFQIADITHQLAGEDIIDPGFAEIVRDVYSVCSQAIHARPLSKKQVDFVRSVTPLVLDKLQKVRRSREDFARHNQT